MLAVTKKTGYALVALRYLAGLADGQVASARQIAERYDAPASLVMNVMKELSAGGYVESIRGAHGGYRLTCDPAEVNMAELLVALEGPVRLAECQTEAVDTSAECTCRMMADCPITDPVHRVNRKLRDFLSNITLAEIVEPVGADQ